MSLPKDNYDRSLSLSVSPTRQPNKNESAMEWQFFRNAYLVAIMYQHLDYTDRYSTTLFGSSVATPEGIHSFVFHWNGLMFLMSVYVSVPYGRVR